MNLLIREKSYSRILQQKSERKIFLPSQLGTLSLRRGFLLLPLPFHAIYMRRKVVWATENCLMAPPGTINVLSHSVQVCAIFFRPFPSSTRWHRLHTRMVPITKDVAICWLNLTAKWWRVLYKDKHSDWHKKNNIWEDVHIEYPLHKQPFHMQEAFTYWMFQYHSLKVVFTMIVINS